MKPPEEVKRDLVQQWLDKAEADYGLIVHLVSENTPFLSAVGFHAQQAVEKFLKSFLVQHQVEFPKTHNLGEILNLVATIDTPLADSLRKVTVLNPFSVETRYPGDIPEISPEDAKKAVKLVSNVRKAIRYALGC